MLGMVTFTQQTVFGMDTIIGESIMYSVECTTSVHQYYDIYYSANELLIYCTLHIISKKLRSVYVTKQKYPTNANYVYDIGKYYTVRVDKQIFSQEATAHF